MFNIEPLQQHLPPGYWIAIHVRNQSLSARVYDRHKGDCSGEDQLPGEDFGDFLRRLVNDAREIEGLPTV